MLVVAYTRDDRSSGSIHDGFRVGLRAKLRVWA